MTEIPAWLEPLVETTVSGMTIHGPEGHLGLRYRQVEEVWDVLLYPLPVEMIGGAHDGGLAAPGFSLDLQVLRSAFARVDAVHWDAHGTRPENTDDGPCIAVEGEFAGQRVWLRILAAAPEGVAPAAKVDGTGRRHAG